MSDKLAKIVVIGANHGGVAATTTILDVYPGHEVVVFDADDTITYLGCGGAMYIGRQIDSTDGLFYASQESLEAQGARVHLNTRVDSIDFDNKTVHAITHDGQPMAESYDKLILSTGSVPIPVRVEGAELQGVFALKRFDDSMKLDAMLGRDDVHEVAVVGAGYIGVEFAEAIQRRGKKARLFDIAETCLENYFDKPLSASMDKVLEAGGVELHYGEPVVHLGSRNGSHVSSIRTAKGEYPADLVVIAAGFAPNVTLGMGNLELGVRGAYSVDRQQRTSDPDVFAIGDCATVYNNATKAPDYIALATNALRSGIVAAHNACGRNMQSAGVQGSNGVGIFGYNMFSTGLNLAKAKALGFNAACVDHVDEQKPEFIKSNNHPVNLRVVFDAETRRILGAQLASYQDISAVIYFFSLAISQDLLIDELPLVDMMFMPHFNKPFNYITMAGLKSHKVGTAAR